MVATALPGRLAGGERQGVRGPGLYRHFCWSRLMSSLPLLATTVGLLVLSQTAAAQGVGMPGRVDTTVYPASDFAAFNPQSAFDIVERTPGFVLIEGEEVRGFGAAGGNVLIDGARPSSKSGGIADALRRIPADQVERVELIRNANTSEAQGQTLVLNVVRVRGGASGTWFLETEHTSRDVIYPRGEVTYSRAVGGWETSIKANAFWEEFPFETRRFNRDASGRLLSTFNTSLPSTFTEAFVSGDASRPLAGGRLNVTGRFGRSEYYFDQPSDIFLGRLPDGAPDQGQLTQYDSLDWVGELGIDFTRPVADWTWKTIGLLSLTDTEVEQSDRRERADGSLIGFTEVVSSARPLELVGRTTLAAAGTSRLRPDFGAEVAYNRLESALAIRIDDGTGPVALDLPSANITVEELRAEAFANLSWQATSTLTLEGGLAVETSEITVAGDADQTQTFSFIKPSVAMAWRATSRLQFRAGVRRSVGQLDFSDFAASAQLDDEQTQAGNPDLGPDQTTRYSVSADYRGGGDLALTLEAFLEDRTDVLEQVLLPSGAPGLANAGDATYRGLKGSATLPLDRWLAGARLIAEGEYIESDFDDPLTGQTRDLTDIYTPVVKLSFRHDALGGLWNWGVDWESAGSITDYFVDETSTYEENANWSAFVETRAFAGLRTRLTLTDINPERGHRLRTFFDPDRSGAVIGTDERRTRKGTMITLRISGAF